MVEKVEIKNCTMYRGDCLDVLARIGAGFIDATIADLPYGTTQCKWDSIIPLAEMWGHLRRVLADGAPAIFTASQPFTSALIMSNPSWFRHEWVWEKNKASGHLNANRRPMRAHEDILVFCSGQPLYQPQMTEGHRPGNYAKRAKQSECYGESKSTEYGGATKRFPRSVLQFAVVNNDDSTKAHPTQKPVALMEYMLRTYTKPGDVVLDMTMGSGTTGVACARLDRRFVGIELDEKYFEIACKRIEATNAEPSLFTAA